MKKFASFLIILAIIVISFSIRAQTQQGNVLIGGNIANFDLTLSTPTTFSANITPVAAWFIHNNIALGGYGNFSVNATKGYGSAYTFGGGVLSRFYAGTGVSVLNHGRFFGEATLGLSGTGGNIGTIGRAQFSAGPGLAYFITPSVGLETLVKYTGSQGINDDNYNHFITLAFGLQVYLPAK